MKYHVTDEGHANKCEDTTGRCPYSAAEHIYANTNQEKKKLVEQVMLNKHDLYTTLQRNKIEKTDLTAHPFSQKRTISAYQIKGTIHNVTSQTHSELEFTKITKLDKPTLKGSTKVMKFQDPEMEDIYSQSQLELRAGSLSESEQTALKIYTSRDFKYIHKKLLTNGTNIDQITPNSEFFNTIRSNYQFLAEEEKTDENVAMIISEIDNGLNKGMGIQRNLYRGIAITENTRKRLFGTDDVSHEELVEKLASKYELGATIEEPSYTSSSLLPSVGKSYARDSGIMIEIKARSGVNLTSRSSYMDEAEVLMPRKSRYKVVGHHKNVKVGVTENMTIIQMVEIDENDNIV